MPKVVAAGHRNDEAFFEPTRVELDKAGVELVIAPFATAEELLAIAKDADALVESSISYDAPLLKQLPNLKALCARGIGVDRFDVDTATELGVICINLPRVFHREVAHHALSLWLALVRQVVPLNKHVRDRSLPRPAPAHHIYGETFGIVSLGNIGKVVASLVRPFEMNVIAYDPFVKEHDGVTLVGSLNELFEQADFVTVHTPLSRATHHLIGYEQFSRMKPTSLFINTGRGPVVNEVELIRALREGKLAGAGLDVQEKEPPDPDNPLLTMENVILTPHVASASDKARVERARWIGIELGRVLNGQWPVHGLVNKSVKPRLVLA